MDQTFSPGIRVEIRDAEWRIQRVDKSSDGGYLLQCQGLSELVRGQTAQFLSKLESNIRILDPAKTELHDDSSDGYLAAQLYIDTILRQQPPVDDRVHVGHRAAMDVLPYQLDPTLQALKQPRQRILIADSVGLGKTLEAGILTSELIARGRGKRILVLAVKSMLSQFQQEFWQRFTIPLVRLDSVGLQRVRNTIPTNHNPFHYFDRAIISIDTLKQTLEYRHHLENAYWDIIIIDEAHNVARRSNQSQRHKLAELLSTRSDTLIMLSATPHDGKPESFASLMNMLDPTAIANPKDYAHEDFRDKGLVIRGFKKDVAEQLTSSFPPREIATQTIDASTAEEAAFSLLAEAKFHTLDSKRRSESKGGAQLFRTTLEKLLFSSPAACLSTVQQRLEKTRQSDPGTERDEDISTLEGLDFALRAITPPQFSKYQLLLDMLRPKGEKSLGWSGKDSDDRLVLFTESILTLDFLTEHLKKDLKLKSKQVAVLKGSMLDRDITSIVEDFGKSSSPIRLLLCSDVASEGINLHHLSYRMIHFDIPWSLMTFQQRNGRIDRYGQSRAPQIRYLMTHSQQPQVRGDQRILEVLIEKDQQAGINIGDPSEFMGLHSAEAEEALVAQAMESDTEVNDPNDLSDIFANLLGEAPSSSTDPIKAFTSDNSRTRRSDLSDVTATPDALFKDNLAYASAALNCIKATLNERDKLIFDIDKDNRQIDFHAPRDLKIRLKYLPREVLPEHDRFILSDDIAQIQETIKKARHSDDENFSALHFLWQQHPVMQWMQERMLDYFGRHTAPVIRLPQHLSEDQHWVIVQGGFPNRRGQALIQSSLAVLVEGGSIKSDCSLPELLQQLSLDGSKLANRAIDGDTSTQAAALPAVVAHAKQQLKALRKQREADNIASLQQHLDKLANLRGKHIGQLDLELQSNKQSQAIKDKRRQDRMHQIDKAFNTYKEWLDETQHTEDEPYLQIVAVLTGQTATQAAVQSMQTTQAEA